MMATSDSRRIASPESSQDYHPFIVKSNSVQKYLTGKPRAGRKNHEHRPLFLKTGVVNQAQGSAYIEQGQTKIICSVYGPREIPKRSIFSMKGIISCKLRRAPFASQTRRPPGPQSEREDQELGDAVKEALEATVKLDLYPKSQIDVEVLVLEDDGAILAASMTVAGLALANSAIHMYDVLVGVSVKHIGQLSWTDPSKSEEERVPPALSMVTDTCLVTIGYLPNLEQTAQIFLTGNTSFFLAKMDMSTATKACLEFVPNIETCLMDFVKEKVDLSQEKVQPSEEKVEESLIKIGYL